MPDELREAIECAFPALARRRQRCTCPGDGSCRGAEGLGVGWACGLELDNEQRAVDFVNDLAVLIAAGLIAFEVDPDGSLRFAPLVLPS
jgi:hypothetical protein